MEKLQNSHHFSIILLKRMGDRGKCYPSPRTPFDADSNELHFVSIALTLAEILVDYDRALLSTDIGLECLIVIDGYSASGITTRPCNWILYFTEIT